MKVKINPLFIAMAVLVALLAFIDVGMINPITMPLAGISTFVYNQQANPLILPAAISAGAGLVNGVLGLFSKNKANKQNIALQRETNALNYQMFQEGNAFNRQMAFDMFNAENAYNTPAAQVERLKDANLNPALVAEGATATTGNGDASTPSAAAAAPMVAPSVQPVGSPFENMFDNVEKLASAFQKVNAGNLSTAQKEFVLEQAKSERLDQINKETSNAILQAYGMKDADASVKEKLKKIEDLDSQISLRVKQGDLAEAEKLLKKAQEVAQGNQNKLFDSTFNYLVEQEQERLNLLKKEVITEGERAITERSKQNLNNAAAANERSQIDINNETLKRLQDTHDDFVRIQHLTWSNMAVDFKKAADTMQDYIDQMHNASLISDEEYNKAKALATIAQRDANWQNFDKVFNYVERLNNGVNKWAPWAFSRTDEVTTYGTDSKGRPTESHSEHRTSYHR